MVEMSLEKKLKQKRNNLQKRLEKEPYPQTNLDSIVLQAGIGLLDDVLKILSSYSIVEKQKLRKLLDKLVVKGLISYVEYKELLGVESTLPACPVKATKKEVPNKQ